MTLSARWRILIPLLLASLGVACRSRDAKVPDFHALRDEYFLGFLKLNPVTCTYLGGDGASADLAVTLRQLKDYSEMGRHREMEFYRKIQKALDGVDASKLSPDDAVDLAVIQAQTRFLLHQGRDRKYYQRALDTYVVEPFRGVDWQMQQMKDLGDGNLGTEAEWSALTARVSEIPGFLETALTNIREGVSAGNYPDRRMVETDGIKGARSNAEYFRGKLMEQARGYLSKQGYRDEILDDLAPASIAAASAYDDFARSLSEIFLEPSPDSEGDKASETLVFRREFQADHYAFGALEYAWAVRNNLKMEQMPEQLFELGASLVAATQQRMIETARAIAEKRHLALSWKTPEEAQSSTRRVLDLLSQDYPKSDDEMFKMYREKAQAMVAYARDKKMFDLPTEYRLDIVETPEVLRDSVDAAYYPAPPFKKSGIGRFYLSPTGGDSGRLKENNAYAMADLCAHEGFPGHDWYYQFLRMHNNAVSPVRWLTPGAVEDSSSMWEDSPAAEGWALYAEALMAEPAPGAPEGYYTPEEQLYQLQGQLLRDARVRLDTGLHTGKLGFDDAVDYYTANVDFLPHACKAKNDDVRRASCDTAHRAIYRYSKWPTQAITYQLGKQAILDLREAAKKLLGEKFSAKEFHERFMSQGTIPPGYVREQVLHPGSP